MRRDSSIDLGPFVLHAPIGRGGMGMVFRGVHADQGVPVAVKVIEHAGGDAARTFRNEVRTMARLEHPGVIWVYDVGEVPPSATEASGGVLPTGAPWIAMEYASRGTLHDLVGKVRWSALLPVVLQLLDALAHAHARGVVHRDLKPGNVLLCGPEDLRPGLKLADFGIAHAVERTEYFTHSGAGGAIGTLSYMAPEQIRADVADYGPHTDLYALGNVIYHLLAGEVPFPGRKGMALVRAQLDLVLPDIIDPDLPSGLMDWLRRCTAKDPAERFQRAADAAAALATLGVRTEAPSLPERLAEALPTVRMTGGSRRAGTGPPPDGGTVPLREDGTVPLPPEGPVTAPVPDLDDFSRHSLHTLSLAPRRVRQVAPAVDGAQAPAPEVPDWRGPRTPRRTLQLLGAGLGLWGVRRLPMVGHEAPRDRLWRALTATHDDGRARAVVLRGTSGTGKTRLGVWLGERAHELGVGEPLRTDAWRLDEAGDALGQLWARWLGLRRLDPEEEGSPSPEARVAQVLARLGVPDPDRGMLLVDPHGDPWARHELSAEVVRSIGLVRPAVLLLDDVGPSAVAFANQLLARQGTSGPVRTLMVLTVDDEALLDDPALEAALDDLAMRPDVEEVVLGPLEPRYRGALVEELLGLAPELAAQVAERTEGNPGFAVQVIGDWVDRGELELGPTGFRLRKGGPPPLPDSLAQVWDGRVRDVLAGAPHRARALLERAAVLGLTVVTTEWRQVCDDPDGTRAREGRVHRSADNEALRDALIDSLFRLRRAEPVAGGFRFVHALFREALVEQASAAGRLASHHRACAAMLQATPTVDAERLGRHLLGAGALDEAVPALLAGVEACRDTSGHRAALALVARAEGALTELACPLHDVRWAEVWNLRATLFAELGQLDPAERWALRVLAHGSREGWATPAARSRLVLGRVHLARGEWREAEHEFRRVTEVAEDPVLAGWGMAWRAWLAGRRGDGRQRRAFTAEAIRRLRRAGSSEALAACWQVVGASCRMEGQLDQADEALQRSLKLYERLGHLFGCAEAHAELGEVARARDDREAATRAYLEAIRLYEVCGSDRAVFPRVHLALVELLGPRPHPAARRLERVRLQLGRQGRELVVPGLSVFQLAAAAAVGDWEGFDHQLRQTEARRGESLDPDQVRYLELARDRAGQAGKRSRVARVQRMLDRWPRTPHGSR